MTAEKLIANPSYPSNLPTRSGWIDLQLLKAPPGEPSERNLHLLLDNLEELRRIARRHGRLTEFACRLRLADGSFKLRHIDVQARVVAVSDVLAYACKY